MRSVRIRPPPRSTAVAVALPQIGKMVERGFTLVPVRMYFKRGLVKVTVGVAKGKKTYDKRETIKRRQVDSETRAMVKERSR